MDHEIDNPGVAKSSTNITNSKSPDLILVGNILPDRIGEQFPRKPPLVYQAENVVNDTVCVATKGVGRMFVPIELIATLSDEKEAEKYQIVAAPGIAPIKDELDANKGKNPSEVGSNRIQYYLWYWKTFIDAIKPVEKFIPEHGTLKLMPGTVYQLRPTWQTLHELSLEQINADVLICRTPTFQLDGKHASSAGRFDIGETSNFLKSFRGQNDKTGGGRLFIIDDSLQVDRISDEEKSKLEKCLHVPNPWSDETEQLVRPNQVEASHGTKVYKIVAATSADDIKITFLEVGDKNDHIDMFVVSNALMRIILLAKPDTAIWINCSFTLNVNSNPGSVIDEYFSYLHNTIHEMGYIIFGAAGNGGLDAPHYPWGQCPACIVVGAYDDTTDKIATFSSGCCSSAISIFLRGTNFALLDNEPKCSGTSFSTAIMSGAFGGIMPLIWDIDHWKTFHETVKTYLTTVGTKKNGCNPSYVHIPREWLSFDAPADVSSDGSGNKVNLRAIDSRSG